MNGGLGLSGFASHGIGAAVFAVGLFFLVISAIAAWRLQATPLFVTATGFAVSSALGWIATTWIEARTGDGAPRWLVAFGHVCGAMGGFFFFVSFAMP
ncbi:MAG: hypothetical protein ACI8TX_002749 [Hyphomicrobiaceae bacterium]|jgi:hypothetical protein